MCDYLDPRTSMWWSWPKAICVMTLTQRGLCDDLELRTFLWWHGPKNVCVMTLTQGCLCDFHYPRNSSRWRLCYLLYKILTVNHTGILMRLHTAIVLHSKTTWQYFCQSYYILMLTWIWMKFHIVVVRDLLMCHDLDARWYGNHVL